MMVMEETLAQTSWRIIYINISSNRIVSLKIRKKRSERDVMIVKRCSLILQNNSFIRLGNLIDLAHVQFVSCLLMIMCTSQMWEIQELCYQKIKGKQWSSFLMTIVLKDKLSKKESLNMEVTSIKHKTWLKWCNRMGRLKTRWF